MTWTRDTYLCLTWTRGTHTSLVDKRNTSLLDMDKRHTSLVDKRHTSQVDMDKRHISRVDMDTHLCLAQIRDAQFLSKQDMARQKGHTLLVDLVKKHIPYLFD